MIAAPPGRFSPTPLLTRRGCVLTGNCGKMPARGTMGAMEDIFYTPFSDSHKKGLVTLTKGDVLQTSS
jgi:hypothetical protein